MDEYIKREAALHIAHGYCHPANVESEIAKLPAVDVRPAVRGNWIHRRFTENICGEECSVCHTTCDVSTNYCPNCGAKMDEED